MGGQFSLAQTDNGGSGDAEYEFNGILSASGPEAISFNMCIKTGCCSVCDVFTVGKNIINFVRNKIALPLMLLFAVYGGLSMIFAGGSISRLDSGKKIFFTALGGFALILTVSVILNTVLLVMTGSSANWSGFINGEVNYTCEKDCRGPWFGKPIVEPVSPCITNMLAELQKKFLDLTITSTNGCCHSKDSYHYKGMAADLVVSGNKSQQEKAKIMQQIVDYLNGKGFYAFCDILGEKKSCSSLENNSEIHVHFDMRSNPNMSCSAS